MTRYTNDTVKNIHTDQKIAHAWKQLLGAPPRKSTYC